MWARTNKYAGYRYAVTSATVPASAPPGSALRITVRWTNFGTAPSYDNWQVSYEVRNDANNVVEDRAVWADRYATSPPSKTTPTARKTRPAQLAIMRCGCRPPDCRRATTSSSRKSFGTSTSRTETTPSITRR